MASRLFQLLTAQTRAASEAAGREAERSLGDARQLLDHSDARNALFGKVRDSFAKSAQSDAVAIHAEISRIANAEAERMAREIQKATGKEAVAAKDAVTLEEVRADLVRSNARRAGNLQRAMNHDIGNAKRETGKPEPERAAALRDALVKTTGKRTKKRFVDSAGRRWKDGVYNAMRARTMAANARRRAQVATLIANGYRLARISNELNANTCAACKFWRGTLVSLTGRAFAGHQTLESAIAYGVFHPNCVHYLEPPGDVPGARPKRPRPLKTPTGAFEDKAGRGAGIVDKSLAGHPAVEALFLPVEEGAKGERKVSSMRREERPPSVEILIGKVSDRLAEAVVVASDGKLNPSDFDLVCETDYGDHERGLFHAWKDHGTPWNQKAYPGSKKRHQYGAEKGKIPLAFEDLMRWPEALDGFTEVRFGGNKLISGLYSFSVRIPTEKGVMRQVFGYDPENKRLLFVTAFYE